jgi:imidazole glycerol phosphate synthase subunit HisF
LLNWIKVIELRGANEVLISAINRGDKELVYSIFNKIREHTNLPVLASTGFADVSDFARLRTQSKVDGLVSAHFFQTKETIEELRMASSL